MSASAMFDLDQICEPLKMQANAGGDACVRLAGARPKVAMESWIVDGRATTTGPSNVATPMSKTSKSAHPCEKTTGAPLSII